MFYRHDFSHTCLNQYALLSSACCFICAVKKHTKPHHITQPMNKKHQFRFDSDSIISANWLWHIIGVIKLIKPKIRFKLNGWPTGGNGYKLLLLFPWNVIYTSMQNNKLLNMLWSQVDIHGHISIHETWLSILVHWAWDACTLTSLYDHTPHTSFLTLRNY